MNTGSGRFYISPNLNVLFAHVAITGSGHIVRVFLGNGKEFEVSVTTMQAEEMALAAIVAHNKANEQINSKFN